jgi:hypothetical protein
MSLPSAPPHHSFTITLSIQSTRNHSFHSFSPSFTTLFIHSVSQTASRHSFHSFSDSVACLLILSVNHLFLNSFSRSVFGKEKKEKKIKDIEVTLFMNTGGGAGPRGATNWVCACAGPGIRRLTGRSLEAGHHVHPRGCHLPVLPGICRA